MNGDGKVNCRGDLKREFLVGMRAIHGRGWQGKWQGDLKEEFSGWNESNAWQGMAKLMMNGVLKGANC